MSETSDAAPVVIETRGNAVIARVQFGPLGDDDLKMLKRTIDVSAQKPGAAVVVIDLSRVEMFHSQELGTIVQIANACTARGQKFRLAALTPRMREILAITHLDQVLSLSDSVEAAMR